MYLLKKGKLLLDDKKFLEIEDIIKLIRVDLDLVNKSFDRNLVLEELKKYEQATEKEDFWLNSKESQEVLKPYHNLKSKLEQIDFINSSFIDLQEFYSISLHDKDEGMLGSCYSEAKKLQAILLKHKLQALFTEDIHKSHAYLEVHAGSGGVDAQDFASMILRMYVRWAQNNQFEVVEVDYNKSEVSGIKSAVLQIKGLYAYGNLISEQGIHRLVRISPFNSEGKRHTSFCAVSVYPAVDNYSDITIDQKDIRIDTYRSTGAGGQHVNTTDSAVRITHMPTGIVVQCQSERSQHRNKETAISLLLSKLYQHELDKKKEQQKNSYKSKQAIDFGSQIRSYVLHPYAIVKDHRSMVEHHNPKNVLDGDIENFILSFLLFYNESKSKT